MHLTISGYSTALYSTWYCIKEWKLLFDAGDGLVASLIGKSGRIRNVFISHADRDHIAGLLQFNQLNAKPGYPKIFYPKHARSISALEEFSKVFDRQVAQTCWKGIDHNEIVPLATELQVQAHRNGHVRAPADTIKSAGFIVQQTRRKLQQQYLHLSAAEIRELRKTYGEENITELITANLLGYSGDTPVENFERWNNIRVLIHEATFLEKSELDDSDKRYNLHSSLEEVMEASSRINIGSLVLGHFSSRYKQAEIDDAILSGCREHKVSFRVYRLLPGIYYPDILGDESSALIWNGAH